MNHQTRYEIGLVRKDLELLRSRLDDLDGRLAIVEIARGHRASRRHSAENR